MRNLGQSVRKADTVPRDGAAWIIKMLPERQRMRRIKRSREAGFTLIEIIVVTLLIGILALLAIPRFPQYPTAGVAARRLLSDIRYAKELSGRLQDTGGNPCCGIYFISSTQYRVFTNNNTSTAAMDPQTGTAMERTMTGKFSGVTLTLSGITGSILKFDSLGTPWEDSGVGNGLDGGESITVSGPGGPRTVTIEPNTGKVTGS
jgi:prepilin-type N-terminal cleavage/methylation domain-containing protein